MKCDAVAYGAGFIEVMCAHDGCVNIETWEVRGQVDVETCVWIDDETIPEDDILNNCEIEMTATQARKLAAALLKAADNCVATADDA